MSTKVTVQQRVSELVQEHGSARAVSDATGIHETVLSRLKSGKRKPGAVVLRQLGLVAEVTYRYADVDNGGKVCGNCS